jgi:AraC-like DNA-binding protein
LTRPMLLEPPSQVDTVGIRFRPGGAYAFLATPLAQFSNGSVALDDLWGRAGRELVERLAETRDQATRVAIISRMLLVRLDAWRRGVGGGASNGDRAVDFMVGRLVRSAGRAAMADLAAEAGVTPRHVQRRFQDRVGISPKQLSRILRFQNTLRHRHAATPLEWVRVAIDCGYADQSHLIRDYADFAGDTPASLLVAEGELSSYFTSPQRLAALFGTRR